MIVVRNLLRNKVRSLITLLGASFGLATFVTLTAIADRVKGGVRDVIEAYQGDVTVQSRRAATPPGSRIPSSDLDRLADLEGVDSVAPVVLGAVRTPWSPFFLVIGVPEALADRVAITGGRRFRGGAPEVLLGELALRRVGAGVGASISLADREFTVVGVHATGAPMVDGAALLDLAAAQQMLGQEGFVNLAVLRTRPGVPAGRVVEAVRRHAPHLTASTAEDFVGHLEIFRTVDTFARGVSAVALLACCFVVTNTLLISAWERTREMGILMAVGWSKARIVASLLGESLVLCAAAGLLANGLAVLFLFALDRTQSTGVGWLPLSVRPGLFWASLGISALLGLASAAYPAAVSAAVAPAQALRHE